MSAVTGGRFVTRNGRTSLQIQTSLAIAFTVAALIIARSWNQSQLVRKVGELWRAIITIVASLTSGMIDFVNI